MSSGWKRYVNGVIAREISSLTRYYDRVIQWMPRAEDEGLLLSLTDSPSRTLLNHGEPVPCLKDEEEVRTAILLNGTFNHHFDIQGLLTGLKPRLSRTSRVVAVLYNPYFSWLYKLANRFGLRTGELPTTFVTRVDLENLAKLSGFEIVRARPCVYWPWNLLWLGDILNRVLPMVPGLRWFSLAYVSVWRPIIASKPAGISCVVPARNERGNIENVLKRFPKLGCEQEIIFVEGHSSDGTWEEIQRVAAAYQDSFQIKTFRQTGKGKADAVRLGFAESSNHLLTILDADLTMPPEMLERFYNAYCQGFGDFINGTRLLYPMEGEAMRPLNKIGNIFFSKFLSWILDIRLGDSLCGTKLLTRHDYKRLVAWRQDFGDFDPFGDFELLFPAAILGLGIVDIPIRYLARTYGSTSISRFRHGFDLLRMVLVGTFKIKSGAV
jgi:Glycosyl transferase family 2